MLNKELSHFSESSKSGNQISEYICSTFLGKYEGPLFVDFIESLSLENGDVTCDNIDSPRNWIIQRDYTDPRRVLLTLGANPQTD